MAEADLMRRLQKLASSLGARLFRQNTGMAWVGKVQRGPGRIVLGHGDIVIRNARPFHAGFKGMSDLGGFAPVVVTPEMIGTTVPIYSQVEVKEDGEPTEEQSAWIAYVISVGGRAGIARNDDDLRAILNIP